MNAVTELSTANDSSVQSPLTETLRFLNDSRLIFQPRYTNAERSRVKAIVAMPDGRFVEMEANLNETNSPLIRDLRLQYSPSDIEAFTRREQILLEQKSSVERRALEDQVIEEERAVAFQAKAKALAMPQVQNCGDKRILQGIRKATSSFEVVAWISVALQKSLQEA